MRRALLGGGGNDASPALFFFFAFEQAFLCEDGMGNLSEYQLLVAFQGQNIYTVQREKATIRFYISRECLLQTSPFIMHTSSCPRRHTV